MIVFGGTVVGVVVELIGLETEETGDGVDAGLATAAGLTGLDTFVAGDTGFGWTALGDADFTETGLAGGATETGLGDLTGSTRSCWEMTTAGAGSYAEGVSFLASSNGEGVSFLAASIGAAGGGAVA